MTAPLQNGSIYEARVWLTNVEQAAVNSFHFLCLNHTGTAVNDTDLARALEAVVAPIYKPAVSPVTSFRGVQVMVRNTPAQGPPPAPVFSNALVGPGTATIPDCARQVAGLIHWTTPLGGPAYRGRTFFPFPTGGALGSSGTPTAGYQTEMKALGDALLAFTSVSNAGALGTATLDLVIFHYRKNPQAAIIPTPITGYIIANKFATLRRRGSYGRPNTSPI